MARILSVEDSADLQQLIGLALQARGYEVHYAFNGKEGYDKILALDPDVILLDLMIPQMNGVTLLSKLKAARELRDIPVIVLSAYGDEADMLSESLKALGAVEYLRKPFEMAELVRRIEHILARAPRKAAETARQEIHKGSAKLHLKFRTVWVDDQLICTLPHKLASLLKLLLEADSGVGREKLLKELWPAGASANALEKGVERLRKALGDEGHRVQTLPHGYEFVG